MEGQQQDYIERLMEEAGMLGFLDFNCPDSVDGDGDIASLIVGMFFNAGKMERGDEILSNCKIRGIIT